MDLYETCMWISMSLVCGSLIRLVHVVLACLPDYDLRCVMMLFSLKPCRCLVFILVTLFSFVNFRMYFFGVCVCV